MAFGLRNMTHKDQALAEMCRVLKPGGRLLVLEFSKVAAPLQKPYDWYSFKILPQLGKMIAGDAESYRYLAESIRMHPGQQELKSMMKAAALPMWMSTTSAPASWRCMPGSSAELSRTALRC